MRTTRKVLSLLLAICTVLICFSHIPVTVRATDFDSLVVEFPNYMVHNGSNRPVPTIYDGQTRLQWNEDFTVSYSNYQNITDTATATVTGLGKYAGFEKTYTYTIIRRDLSDHFLLVQDTTYQAGPIMPEFSVCYEYAGNDYPVSGIVYTDVAEQNVNVGQGFVRAICTGNDYGAPTGNFQIELGSEYIELPGHYMGQVDGTLDGQTVISEIWLTPGKFTGCVQATGLNMAYYELHKIVNLETGETVPVTTYTSDVNFSASTTFNYDFSSVYNDNPPEGVTCYILGYEWIDEAGGYYSGAMIMYIVSKVPSASTILMDHIAGDQDFRHDYLTVYSEDGALEKSVWSVSDSSVATVDQGAVTFLKPGTVTVTAKCGNLSAKQTLTAEAIDMEDTTILDWKDGKAALMYDYILLKDGIDYTATATTKNGITTVTATGKGVFEGTVTAQFDAATGRPAAEMPPVIPTVIGDLDRDSSVNNNDVVVLLWHTLFPEEYPLTVNGDLTKDGSTNNNDVVLLLWHTLFPDEYPLN